MNLFEGNLLLERLDSLIRRRATGCIKQLANRLDVSERTAERLIADLRDQGLPICYDRGNNTYYYEKPVSIRIEIKVDSTILLQIRGGAQNTVEDFLKPPDFGGKAFPFMGFYDHCGTR
jgi:HTH domain